MGQIGVFDLHIGQIYLQSLNQFIIDDRWQSIHEFMMGGQYFKPFVSSLNSSAPISAWKNSGQFARNEKAVFNILLDISLGECIGHPSRQDGIGKFHMNVDETAVTNRFYTNRFLKAGERIRSLAKEGVFLETNGGHGPASQGTTLKNLILRLIIIVLRAVDRDFFAKRKLLISLFFN
ncbi:MAG: hypothetical protein A2992_07040 [Elusimicrobia bacterium RIFCSPLOWO2_01_FULL_59_12]|nr:MAG: hypothetical protein A2992_07040 [Elusimicrobia bacterium RIFCSPLOWO2_01_FULL_59_12]